MTTMTRSIESIEVPACLLLAFELSERTWMLGFSVGRGCRPRYGRSGRDVDRLRDEIGARRLDLVCPQPSQW